MSAGAELNGEPILVVDDTPANAKLLRVVLERAGYDVRTASDGQEMEKVLEGFRPRLVLMDLQLPGVDGLELTRRLKSQDGTAQVIVIAVTSYAMKGDEERALDAGCDGYMSKPIDVNTIADEVAHYLKDGAGGG